MWLFVGCAGLALLVLGWIIAASGERQAGIVELDIPELRADRPAVAGDKAPTVPASVPPASDRVAEATADLTNSLSIPAATAEAFAGIPLAPGDGALPPAPDPALSERTDQGILPRRADDGRMPWQVYGRPFTGPSGQARIAVIITGLGRSPTVTREIVRRLPGAFTLAYEARVEGVDEMARAARAAGHEILLSLPVQDDAFPFVDRGPEALGRELSPEENRARLERLLGGFSGYVGVITDARPRAGGSSGSGPDDPLALVGEVAAARGLLDVASGPDGETTARSASGLSVPLVQPDLAIGADLAGEAVDARLAELEEVAEAKGYAVAIASPTPIAAKRLANWAGSLENKNMVLAPVSAIAAAMERP